MACDSCQRLEPARARLRLPEALSVEHLARRPPIEEETQPARIARGFIGFGAPWPPVSFQRAAATSPKFVAPPPPPGAFPKVVVERIPGRVTFCRPWGAASSANVRCASTVFGRRVCFVGSVAKGRHHLEGRRRCKCSAHAFRGGEVSRLRFPQAGTVIVYRAVAPVGSLCGASQHLEWRVLQARGVACVPLRRLACAPPLVVKVDKDCGSAGQLAHMWERLRLRTVATPSAGPVGAPGLRGGGGGGYAGAPAHRPPRFLELLCEARSGFAHSNHRPSTDSPRFGRGQ